jgi:hypothetical protein
LPSVAPLAPVHRTFSGLQGFENPQDLVNAAVDIEVVDQFVAQNALRIDDVQAAQADPLLLDENSVVAGNLLGDI